jgi:hypothetical protein
MTVIRVEKTISPIRLKPMAENDEARVKDLFSQVPIRLKLTNPTISQQRRVRNSETDEMRAQTVKRKQINLRLKAK